MCTFYLFDIVLFVCLCVFRVCVWCVCARVRLYLGVCLMCVCYCHVVFVCGCEVVVDVFCFDLFVSVCLFVCDVFCFVFDRFCYC